MAKPKTDAEKTPAELEAETNAAFAAKLAEPQPPLEDEHEDAFVTALGGVMASAKLASRNPQVAMIETSIGMLGVYFNPGPRSQVNHISVDGEIVNLSQAALDRVQEIWVSFGRAAALDSQEKRRVDHLSMLTAKAKGNAK